MKPNNPPIFTAITVVSALSMTSPVLADSWDMIGQRNVKERIETDTISLSGHRRYQKIKICVYRNPVNFKDVDVYFENGGHQDVKLKSRINAGNCTRVIDLKGGNRDLDRIVMRYEETSFRLATATVKVFAR